LCFFSQCCCLLLLQRWHLSTMVASLLQASSRLSANLFTA
jgi:hypothetical protein